jgi:cytolysin-activating lysine-acyltransferase
LPSADATRRNITLLGVIDLMAQSEIHRRWSVADIQRLIAPPIDLGQAVLLISGDRPVGYASYALLTEEAETGYIDGTRKLQAGDWNAGDRLWWIDAIAPHGHARFLPRQLKSLLRSRGLGNREIRFRRSYTDTRSRRYARAMT